MSNGFDMATALVARAKEHREQIGDHGDPYEEAIHTRVVGLRLRIIVKEIFDHLRSALDYTAREICSRCPTCPPEAKVYFPIVGLKAKQADFRSRVGKLMPGLLADRPDLLPVLESFQPFSGLENEWLAHFSTLCNESKHERLTVSIQENARVISRRDEAGVLWSEMYMPSGKLVGPRHTFFMFDNYPPDGVGEYSARYLSLPAIDEELIGFLVQSISGVDQIIKRLVAAT